jgi:hypothetical protein
MDSGEDELSEPRRTDGTRESSVKASPSLTNGAHGGRDRSLAAWYLEELRAARRLQPPGGLRIFNPDETPEERDVRIREALAGLKRLQAFAAAGTEEDGRVWDEVMKAVERSRAGLPDAEPGLPDS